MSKDHSKLLNVLKVRELNTITTTVSRLSVVRFFGTDSWMI
jgi:hypothetical protein